LERKEVLVSAEEIALQKQLIAHYRDILQGKTPISLDIHGTVGRFLNGVI